MPALLMLRETFPMPDDVIDVFDVNPVNLV